MVTGQVGGRRPGAFTECIRGDGMVRAGSGLEGPADIPCQSRSGQVPYAASPADHADRIGRDRAQGIGRRQRRHVRGTVVADGGRYHGGHPVAQLERAARERGLGEDMTEGRGDRRRRHAHGPVERRAEGNHHRRRHIDRPPAGRPRAPTPRARANKSARRRSSDRCPGRNCPARRAASRSPPGWRPRSHSHTAAACSRHRSRRHWSRSVPPSADALPDAVPRCPAGCASNSETHRRPEHQGTDRPPLSSRRRRRNGFSGFALVVVGGAVFFVLSS